jgi:hypothetical protein
MARRFAFRVSGFGLKEQSKVRHSRESGNPGEKILSVENLFGMVYKNIFECSEID